MKNEKGEVLLALPLGECADSFNLEKAVCNHGFFMMAPNRWIPSSNTLERPLRLVVADDSTSSSPTTSTLAVTISHPSHIPSVLIRVHATNYLSPPHKQAILAQVARMLRISAKDEKDMQEFRKSYPIAKTRKFGRLFRSPSLFEDAVKSILLCNCTWMKTLDMAHALCELQLELTNDLVRDNKDINMNIARMELGVKRKRSSSMSSSDVKKDEVHFELGGKSKSLGDFPTAKELASLSEELLKKRCNLGYRARHIIDLAKSVDSDKSKLEIFEKVLEVASSEKLYRKLLKVKGFGPFASANFLMCIGSYERIPVDSETIRHLSEHYARKDCNKKNVTSITKEIYGKYAPFQSLVYWLERVEYYESKLGALSQLPSSSYSTVSGRLT